MEMAMGHEGMSQVGNNKFGTLHDWLSAGGLSNNNNLIYLYAPINQDGYLIPKFRKFQFLYEEEYPALTTIYEKDDSEWAEFKTESFAVHANSLKKVKLISKEKDSDVAIFKISPLPKPGSYKADSYKKKDGYYFKFALKVDNVNGEDIRPIVVGTLKYDTDLETFVIEEETMKKASTCSCLCLLQKFFGWKE